MSTFSDLVSAQSEQEIEAVIIGFLQNPGGDLPPLPATSWSSTSLGTYFLKSESLVLSQLSMVQSRTAMGGYFQLAADPSLQFTSGPLAGTSGWVDLGAEQFYNLTREQASTTVRTVTVTAATGVGPTNITSNSTQIVDSLGNIFVCDESGIVPIGGSKSLQFHAQQPGSQGNLPNATPVKLVTAIAGVTVALGDIITGGTDIESDQSLIARCLNQWTSLGTGSPQGAWINWCFAASPEVRYATTLAFGDGTVGVCVYGDGNDVGAAGLSAIGTYITSREPQCISIAPGSPINASPIQLNMTAQIYGPASASVAGLAAATTALSLLIQTTPVGGYAIAPGTPDTFGISRSDLETVITNSSAAITKVVVTVSGAPASGDFIMPPDSGVPRVATAPSGSNPFGLNWNNT
jgi:hypothetical protein